LDPARPQPRRFLIVYAQTSFWSMGAGMGAGSFSRTPRALAERGHEVHIVLPAQPGRPAGREDWEGIPLHRFPSRIAFVPRRIPFVPFRLAQRAMSYLAYQAIGTRAGMRVAREIRPDLVLAFGAYEAPVARRIAVRLGVPNVTRLFGNTASVALQDPVRFYLNFPDVLGFRTPCARLILTNDGADGEEVARRCGVALERFVHLRNGLDFDVFQPGPPDPAVRERLGVAADQPLLLTVTRLAYEKKLHRVLEAMPALLARVPRAVAVLLGEGPEHEALAARADELGIEKAVRMPGAVANRDLPAWYRTAAVSLSLLDRTNASNPVFEAMACGRCVVALDAGTTREVIVPDRTGVLVSHEDLPRLGSILADLLEDEPRRESLGEAARAHVRGLLLDPPARMEQEVQILLQVLAEEEERRGKRAAAGPGQGT
jgi:glycosyltransferase involved in cell wall biosynthesis